jgi:hypothetical protein
VRRPVKFDNVEIGFSARDIAHAGRAGTAFRYAFAHQLLDGSHPSRC